ncbi:MAG: YifB family Mg chelatase-like AAA ATPase [Treponemataceae bacterium]|nr:YifB family Mg chelatase-like AAA ATPase [Treponemataceae bacterium]
MHIVSFSPFGYEGSIVTVEVDLRRGIPAVDMVGLADNAVKESRERMRSAIINSGFDFPKERVLISLSPADVKKEGAGFDLAIALAVLLAQKNLDSEDKAKLSKVLVMGELELSGRLRPVRGVHAAVSTAVEEGVEFCIVCEENSSEASGVKGAKVFACKDLREAFSRLVEISNGNFEQETKENQTPVGDLFKVEFPPVEEGMDFDQVLGLPFLVRGLQIAAAGAHNLIAFGPPGCGKTLALQRFPSLLPYLDNQEAQSTTRISSLAGLIQPNQALVRKKPFRMPHQSASLEGMIGGGAHCMPGEVSLAHNGVLFLDEASEFKTSVLQMLRVPLEQSRVTLSRAGRHTVYPANFQLLLATNPCPCGNFGDSEKICLCSARAVEQHWKKFSAPLLDRIDIRVPVFNSSKNNSAENQKTSISTEELRIDIKTAIEIQKSRQGKLNSRLTPEEINYYCKLDQDANEYLNNKADELCFSSRAIHSCIKIARTIADMRGSYGIELEDLKEAVEYRKNEGGLSLCF